MPPGRLTAWNVTAGPSRQASGAGRILDTQVAPRVSIRATKQ